MMTTLQQRLAEFNPERPLRLAESLPSSWYRDSAILELERKAVFQNTWQSAGLAHQVSTPGSFLTTEIAGEPIAVVRDTGQTLRAFANVCRHRGASVLSEPCGQTTRLRCRYHGWTYDLTGQLRGVPEFEGVEDFHREEDGLPTWPVAIWGPLVWVHLGQPTDLAHEICQAQTQLAGAGFESLVWVAQRTYELNCNWKVYVDNYLDGGYHINTVHPMLGGILDYGRYRTEIFASSSVQLAPLASPDPQDPVAQVRTGSHAQYWWVFPNLMVNLTDGVMDINRVIPLGVDRCRVIFDFFFRPSDCEADRTFQHQSMEVSHHIQLEDVEICEDVQRGFASRTYRAGRFSAKREGAVFAFHQLLARRLQEASSGMGCDDESRRHD